MQAVQTPLRGEIFSEIAKPLVEVEPQFPPVISPPPSLQELASVDRLLITKRLRVKSVLFLRGKRNRFLVRTGDQQLIYNIEEENSWWVGYLCYGLRPMELKVSDVTGCEVMRIVRPYACTSRVLPCQLQRIQVFAPPGHRLGSVEQLWTPVKPLYAVRNRAGEVAFRISGPYVTVSLFSDIQFTISRADGSRVGHSRKSWQGVAHALLFSPITDRFGVSFDISLSTEEKALLLAATLLIDYMYYDG